MTSLCETSSDVQNTVRPSFATANPGMMPGLRAGMAVVDVACGSGSLTRLLGEAVGPAGSAIGVDMSAAMLREAAGRTGPSSIRYELGDALALPLEDASVDAATIAFGLDAGVRVRLGR